MIRVVATVSLMDLDNEVFSAEKKSSLKTGVKLGVDRCELTASRWDDDGQGTDRDFHVVATYYPKKGSPPEWLKTLPCMKMTVVNEDRQFEEEFVHPPTWSGVWKQLKARLEVYAEMHQQIIRAEHHLRVIERRM